MSVVNGIQTSLAKVGQTALVLSRHSSLVYVAKSEMAHIL